MKNKKGFVLAGVVIILLFLLIVVPVMVKWVENDTKISVKDQKSSRAFNLAEAAVDRGYWKVKSSTSTFALVSLGNVLAGYNFDTTYTDISGGSYRIRISSGPDLDQVTIFGEGRDSGNNETRSIKAIYNNSSVPGAILSAGTLSASDSSIVHWGPVMAKGNIIVSGDARTIGYPRKLSMQTVLPSPANLAIFDPTGDTNPPNTDSLEWWSNYNVPDLPVFDFITMKASAAVTGTLNCRDKYYMPSKTSCGSGSGSKVCSCNASGVCTCAKSGCSCTCSESFTLPCTNCGGPVMACCSSTVLGGAVTCAYGASGETGCTDCTVTSLFLQTTKRDEDYTWYWDHNATLMGYNGIKGTVIVQGDLNIPNDKDDRYCKPSTTNETSNCTVPVPPNAWREYQKYDTTAKNQYPGDDGLHKNTATYKLGSNETGELWRMPSGTSGLGADLGVYGFVYVHGDFTRNGPSDIYGAIWVEGDVTGLGNTMIFYNSKLKVPTLNVVLVRESWQEQMPSAQAWP